VNLDAYFSRIGYTGPRTPSIETLNAVHRAHAQAIPFENLDVLLGRPISLAPSAVFDKLVRHQRGGYCFEQNGLLAAALRALGFRVTPMIGRTLWQVPTGVTVPKTHLLLNVEIDGQPWLADAGFGGVGLTAAIRLDSEAEQGDPGARRRLVREGRFLVHQVRFDTDWLDVYRFSPEEAPLIDFEVANWYTSTHPESRFRKTLIVARVDGDRRLALQNREFAVRRPGRPAEKREIESPDELLAILAEHFGLRFPPGTRFGPPGSPWPA
jgi:N-hydroxyarylamine O-acetyltransferase